MKKVVLVNPQWQGGADKNTLDGAREIQRLYLKKSDYEIVPISECNESLAFECGIIGFHTIAEQTKEALAILRQSKATHVFTVGGGCDADISSIFYLNEIYRGDLTVLWLDAHGDINSPEESQTHLFYGMPVRALLGECGDIFSSIKCQTLCAEQFMLVGSRDLDKTEKTYISKKHIPLLLSSSLSDVADITVKKCRQIGKRYIYIHLDLDVIDPYDFSSTPLPVPNGIPYSQLKQLLLKLQNEFCVVGMGLFEYLPCGQKKDILEQVISFGLNI
ncbi:MAG: arginase family protein [Parabacteroides sp.]|nr:arginase family protein [Parabacteroides sp.]